MKKLIYTLLFSMLSINAFAFDGEISIGKYLNSTLRSRPGREYTIPNNYAEYVAEVEIGHKMFKDIFRPYLKLGTLMDENDGYLFHPSSIKYEVGGRVELYKGIYIDLSHLCWHPIDAGGSVEQYNLIKVGVKF